jgi:HNH endonuclease
MHLPRLPTPSPGLCDLDHTEPWGDGGATNSDNVTALCARHHNAKHHAGWRVIRRRNGSYEWNAPTGHTYAAPPPDDG